MDLFKRVGDAFLRTFSGDMQQAEADRQPCGFHIAILSFDRPEYLSKVLKSLRPQLSVNDKVTLFQDGHLSRHQDAAVASPQKIRACISAFKAVIPWGDIVHSSENLGIALNYERAETHVFETLGAEACLLLEDDLVLSPNFIEVTTQLLGFARQDDRIGYVSACGNLWAKKEEQRRRSTELMPMHENWGAAMTRKSWAAERTFRSGYLDLVRNADYKVRDHDKIRAFYKLLGWDCKFTSQDSARWIACLERGAIRLSTFACHARYIGIHGVHFTPALYELGKFADTVMFDGSAPMLSKPSNEWIAKCLAEERKRFTGQDTSFYPTHGS